MSNKRILIFSLAYYPMIGGAEIAVKEITDRIPSIEFDIVTLRFNKEHLREEKIGNCMIYRINTSKTLYPFKALFLAIKLHKVRSYDAIWAIMANWAGFAALFFKYFHPSIPYILTLQEGDPIEYIENKVRFIYPLWKRIFTYADKVQAISTFLAHWAKNVGFKEEVEIIPNGVDIERFKIKDSRFKNSLITTSRLVEKNGIKDLIESIKYLPQNIKLTIVGSGPLESELKHHSRILNLESRIKFLGHIPHNDLPEHLHEADIFIRPSLSEGFGVSFVEAMAAGLPVVATQVGGIVDFLKNGETGLFCEVNNPKSIADKVMEYINNPELVSKVVENARKMVEEKYDWDLIAKEMKMKVFDKV